MSSVAPTDEEFDLLIADVLSNVDNIFGFVTQGEGSLFGGCVVGGVLSNLIFVGLRGGDFGVGSLRAAPLKRGGGGRWGDLGYLLLLGGWCLGGFGWRRSFIITRGHHSCLFCGCLLSLTTGWVAGGGSLLWCGWSTPLLLHSRAHHTAAVGGGVLLLFLLWWAGWSLWCFLINNAFEFLGCGPLGRRARGIRLLLGCVLALKIINHLSIFLELGYGLPCAVVSGVALPLHSVFWFTTLKSLLQDPLDDVSYGLLILNRRIRHFDYQF